MNNEQNHATRCVELWMMKDEDLYVFTQSCHTPKDLESFFNNIWGYTTPEGEPLNKVDWSQLFQEHCA